jgi:hypothetical protein
LILGVRFIVAPFFDDLDPFGNPCRLLALVTQFCLISSEVWYVALNLDLLKTLSNPFSNYHYNMVMYHGLAWGSGLLTAMVLGYEPSARTGLFLGRDGNGFCWVDSDSSNILWAIFYIPVIIFSVSSIWVSLFVYRRLKGGIRDTYKTRRRTVIRSLKVGRELHPSGM